VFLFLGLKVRKSSDVRKGMIILAPGTKVKFLDDNGNEFPLEPSLIMDILTVLNFFMILCEKNKLEQYNKDKELDMKTVEDGEEPKWPEFIASETWCHKYGASGIRYSIRIRVDIDHATTFALTSLYKSLFYRYQALGPDRS